ncbi:MAG: extracellular solute-binding protein [Spirochaetes bacterium]|nr:extracellular solute-binding protein [Spirochaetota bacterium]
MKKFAVLALVCCLLGFFAAPAVFAAETKLTIWGRDIPDDSADHVYVRDLIKGFQAKYPDIKIDYVALGDPGLADKTKITMAAGSGLPEIFQTWGGSVMGGYADASQLLDLTSELKGVPGSAAAQQAMTWKGKIYGVAPFFAIAGIFVNEGIFKTNNLKVPATVEDFNAVCTTLLAKGIQPFACGEKDKWPALALYMYLTNRYGGDASAKASARKLAYNSDAFVKAAQLYQSWFKKGYFGATPLGEGYGDAQQLMATGKAAMHVTGSWMCAQYSNSEFTDQKLGFYAFPALKTGSVGGAADIMGMTDIGFAATKVAASKKDAVVKFMKYAMSQEACQSEPGRICSVPGVKAKSALTSQASAVFATAKTVTFWWDQDLPPSVTSPLNDTIQTFFLPDTDVKKSLSSFEALCIENMGAVKK